MIFDGGIPRKQGVVGVSGGDNKQDQTVCEAAVSALKLRASQLFTQPTIRRT